MTTAALPVSRSWFRAQTLPDGTVVLDEPHVHPLLCANIHLVAGRECDLLVDAGNGVGDLAAVLRRFRALSHKPLIAVLTHAHADHQGGMHLFAERVVHPLEAGELAEPSIVHPLLGADWPDGVQRFMAACGAPLPEVLVTAVPEPDFDPGAFRLAGCAPTRLVDEGDTIDTGDRMFRVLHLPGHSPGGIGLYEEKSGLLFSGDVVYDGDDMIDEIPGADAEEYVRTMRRLRELPVSAVHSGHGPSFGGARLTEIADRYLATRGSA